MASPSYAGSADHLYALEVAAQRDSAPFLAELIHSAQATRIIYVAADICGLRRHIGIKLEGENPYGSIKDRTAISLLESIGAAKLDDASLLVESTSGNIGVALAALSWHLNLQFRAVVDPMISPVMLGRLKNLNAMIETVTTRDSNGGYLLSRLQRVREICAADPRAVWTNQYSNPANPEAHYRETGPEIDQQTDGAVDAIFVAVSTGGTIAGIARYFRQVRSLTRIIGVDAVGSVIFVDMPGPRLLSGIGASRKSDFIGPSTVDDFELVSDQTAFAFCRTLHEQTGLQIGGSSGAVLAACVRYLSIHPEIRHPVCVSADRGSNYDQTIFDNKYLHGKGIVLSRDLLRPRPGQRPVRFTLMSQPNPVYPLARAG